MHTLELAGVFVQIGLVPNTDWLKGTVKLSPRGEIEVDARGQTSVPGVFAAGDCTVVPYKQIVIAMGEGAKASLERVRSPDPLAAVRRRLVTGRRIGGAHRRRRASMASAAPPHRLSAGVVVVSLVQRKLKFLLLRAYRNWDFPKGLVEPGEEPDRRRDARGARGDHARRHLLRLGLGVHGHRSLQQGQDFPLLHRAQQGNPHQLPVNPELGVPEHHEARWVDYRKALTMVSPRLKPVVHWAYRIINHEPASREAASRQ